MIGAATASIIPEVTVAYDKSCALDLKESRNENRIKNEKKCK